MANPLDRITNLIKKTGDTIVVLDSEGHPAYVVLSFDKYEKGEGMAEPAYQPAPVAEPQEAPAHWENQNSGEHVDNWYSENAKFAPISDENSLNQAEKSDKNDDHVGSEEKYYFEPID